MPQDWIINAFGIAAALCSAVSFIPQIMKLIREKDASGVSMRMFAITTAGFVFWTAYGALSGSWPVALSNTANLALAGTILLLKLHLGGSEQKPAPHA